MYSLNSARCYTTGRDGTPTELEAPLEEEITEMNGTDLRLVTPVQAEVHVSDAEKRWIPACAGMTESSGSMLFVA